jgi:hypothetical protein
LLATQSRQTTDIYRTYTGKLILDITIELLPLQLLNLCRNITRVNEFRNNFNIVILMQDFNVKLTREDIFKPTNRNEVT